MPTSQTAPASRSRLVVVSNRLPVTLRRGPGGPERIRSTGGLVAAFEPVLERRGGTWIGWPGLELRRGETLSARHDLYRIKTVRIPRGMIRGYYHGFSNRTLWPLLHSLPGQSSFRTSDWEAYQRVNSTFAKVTAQAIQPGDLVWVNDYQLMLVPGTLRQRAPRARIGFFLHTPFPPYDVFRVLPWAEQLLVGLLAADLIGLHVSGYIRNFFESVERLLGARVDRRRGLVEHDGFVSHVIPLPVGVDYEHLEALARTAPVPDVIPSGQVVLGVDRLDYTKGIPQRIQAFAQLLEQHPEHRQKIELLQLAVPSRAEVAEYRHLKREIDELVGRVNGRFGTATWTPIRYLYRSVPPERLAGLYRDANVALVTPLRDGMNLVAKEFVACQLADPGVLVLSRMAGAAETMTEALLVNPYDIDATAATLHRALGMGHPERRSRMRALRRRERSANVHVWAEKFLERLAAG